MEKIIITETHRTVAGLSQLANQINTEHEQVLTALSGGLAHARQAGIFLIQAKSMVPHGNWLAWIQAHCKITPRTAQRYMELAKNWEQILANGGESSGMIRALKLLTKQKEESPNATSVSHLPAPLDYYSREGLINDDALHQLLELEHDYGPELLTSIRFASEEITAENAFWLLNAIRPLDHPTLWPFPTKVESAGAHVLAAAANIFLKDGLAREGKVPQWEVTAFWFGSTMVHFADAVPEFGRRFASILHHHLGVWRESFRTALVMVACVGQEFFKGEEKCQWWGFHSDLRHAGALHAAQEIRAHPALERSLDAGLKEIERYMSYVLPSSMQRRLDDCPSEGTDSDPEAPEEDHGDAWEHPADRLGQEPRDGQT